MFHDNKPLKYWATKTDSYIRGDIIAIKDTDPMLKILKTTLLFASVFCLPYAVASQRTSHFKVYQMEQLFL